MKSTLIIVTLAGILCLVASAANGQVSETTETVVSPDGLASSLASAFSLDAGETAAAAAAAGDEDDVESEDALADESEALTDESEEEDEYEDEEEDEEDEEGDESGDVFFIGLEDSLVGFILRHRDVRRDCDEIRIDIQLQSGTVDPSLQKEYMGCMNYKRELEDDIMELANLLSKAPAELPPPGPPPSSQPASSGGLLSSITSRLPGGFF